MNFEQTMQIYQQRVQQALDHWLPAGETPPRRLHEAMRYAVLYGGKRIRPLLIYFTGEALAIDRQQLDGIAAAVELIHGYSLVHDDLPAMDDDDLRRGRLTCHKAFDEATAILVGDGLQALAFYVLAHDPQLKVTASQRIAMLETLAFACGSRGMVGGQMMDMTAVGQTLNLPELENMHIHKTGALIHASVKMSALAAENLPSEQLASLEHYAKCVGLAFQIQDDILDVEANTEMLGKSQGADLAHNKPTYPVLVGLNEAKQMANDLLQQAMESLQVFGEKAEALRQLAGYIVNRDY